MKKAIALLLCLLMVTSLVACGNNNTATDDSQTSQVETENNETSTPEESETPTEAETETPAESEEPTETETSGEGEELYTVTDTVIEVDGHIIPIPKPSFAEECDLEYASEPFKALLYLNEDESTHVDVVQYILYLVLKEGTLTEDIFRAYVDMVRDTGYTQNVSQSGYSEILLDAEIKINGEDKIISYTAGKKESASSVSLWGMTDGNFSAIKVTVHEQVDNQ